MSIINVINPVSSKSTYTQNDIVDFNVTFDGMSIVKNSIRITGLIKVSNGATNLKTSDEVYYDGTCGISGVFQQIICSTEKQGVIESNNQYPRFVKSKTQAMKTNSQLSASSANLTELRVGNDDLTTQLLCRSNKGTGFVNKTTGSLIDAEYTSFSMKPDICFNKTDDHIGSGKTGALTISLRLSTNGQFLFGSTVGTNYSFTLKNLQLQYTTFDGDTKGPLNMESIYVIKNTVETNNAQLATSVPAICRSVSCVFHEEATLNSTSNNNLENQLLPGIERVEFNFNGDNQQYLTFTMKYLNELLFNYIASWGIDPIEGKSEINNNQLNEQGNCFGIGLNFGQLVNLSNQKFGMNIVSNVTSARKYAVFMIFRAVVSL